LPNFAAKTAAGPVPADVPEPPDPLEPPVEPDPPEPLEPPDEPEPLEPPDPLDPPEPLELPLEPLDEPEPLDPPLEPLDPLLEPPELLVPTAGPELPDELPPPQPASASAPIQHAAYGSARRNLGKVRNPVNRELPAF
jgi:hypothetical protein